MGPATRACGVCRSRKVFCRGVPGSTCDNCAARGDECRWRPDRRRKEHRGEGGEGAPGTLTPSASLSSGGSAPSPPPARGPHPLGALAEVSLPAGLPAALASLYRALPQHPPPPLAAFAAHPLLVATQLWVGASFASDPSFAAVTGTYVEPGDSAGLLGRAASAMLADELARIDNCVSAPNFDPLAPANLAAFAALGIVPRALMKEGRVAAIMPLARIAVGLVRRFAHRMGTAEPGESAERWLARRQWVRLAWGFIVLDMGRVALQRAARMVLDLRDFAALPLPPGDHVPPGSPFPPLTLGTLHAAVTAPHDGHPPLFALRMAEYGPNPLRMAVLMALACTSELFDDAESQSLPLPPPDWSPLAPRRDALLGFLISSLAALHPHFRSAEETGDLALLRSGCGALWGPDVHSPYVLCEALAGLRTGILRLSAPDSFLGSPAHPSDAAYVRSPRFLLATASSISLSLLSTWLLRLAHARDPLAAYLLASPLVPHALLHAALFHAACARLAPLDDARRDARRCAGAISACSWKNTGGEAHAAMRAAEVGVAVAEGERRGWEESVGGRGLEGMDADVWRDEAIEV